MAKKHKAKGKLTPDEQAHLNHWEKFHLPAFDIVMTVRPRIRNMEILDGSGRKKKMATFSGWTLEDRIIRLIIKVEKAFGGCYFCYGKGYGTETKYSGTSRKRTRLPVYIPCEHCERGKQFAKILATLEKAK